MENFADLYTDYLITSTSYTTATGMASLLSIKHDGITRELSTGDYDSKFLWKRAKVYIEELTRSGETVFLSFDDSIQEKCYTDESEMNCWHWDHVFDRSVKGVNFMTALVEVGGMRLAERASVDSQQQLEQTTNSESLECHTSGESGDLMEIGMPVMGCVHPVALTMRGSKPLIHLQMMNPFMMLQLMMRIMHQQKLHQ